MIDKTKAFFAKKMMFQKSIGSDHWSEDRFDMYNKDVITASDELIMSGFIRHITTLTPNQKKYATEKLQIPRAVQDKVIFLLEVALQKMWDEVGVDDESIHEKILKQKETTKQNVNKEIWRAISNKSIGVEEIINDTTRNSRYIPENDVISMFITSFSKVFDTYQEFKDYIQIEKMIIGNALDNNNNNNLKLNMKAMKNHEKS